MNGRRGSHLQKFGKHFPQLRTLFATTGLGIFFPFLSFAFFANVLSQQNDGCLRGKFDPHIPSTGGVHATDGPGGEGDGQRRFGEEI